MTRTPSSLDSYKSTAHLLSTATETLRVGEWSHGELRPALQRLEKDGLITSKWGTTDNNRRARYYRITASGRKALGDELESWRRFAAGLEAVLRTP
ncbi:MAG: helix-turn-helix transcriptional regulator [Myxococcales bacterium]